MPNFDGGHYFLTALIPIKNAEYIERDGRKNSPVHMVRDALAVLPKAQQSQATKDTPFNSPFACNTRTHFARLVVIDDVINNGHNPINTLKVAIGSRLGDAQAARLNPTRHQPYDQLSHPYLFFAADFDASSGDDGELGSYLRELWQTMEKELHSILEHCEGFDCKRSSPETFYEYVKSCQLETTMSFNDYDYRLDTPGLRSISIPLLLFWAGAAALATLAGLLGALVTMIRSWPDFDAPTILWIATGGLGLALFYSLYRYVLRQGARSFATVPNTDLPCILKALYLQQRFTQFAIDAQGFDDRSLHSSFGKFLAEHQPNDLATCTQAPGVIPVTAEVRR
jgi:hypothetical protein